jgi:uncharacterized membrane protein YfcA
MSTHAVDRRPSRTALTSTQLLVVAGASLLGATVKSVTGLGYPVLAIPLIALVLGVDDAVVLVALPNFAANAYLCWESRDVRDQTRDLPTLVGFGIVGAVIGTFALVRLPEEPLLIVLALTIGVFVVNFLRRPDVAIDPRTATRWSPFIGTIVGILQGAIGVSGPVVATWVHGYRLHPRVFVHTVTFIFGVTGAAQIVVLVAQGQFSRDRLVAAAVAAVPVAVVTPLGVRLRDRLAGPLFDRAVLAVLLASAVSLVVDALS